ncbi:MAG TPA: phosphatidate cytidylyltransferase [Bacillota bacterium]|nr:phosphatidate cytidylyltransferase [Bacillota bacterium]
MKQRIVTAILALIVFVPFLIIGGLPFIIFSYFLATIAIFELLRMNKLIDKLTPKLISVIVLWLILIPSTIATPWNELLTKEEVLILFVMLILGYSVLSKNKFTFNEAGFTLLSVIYVALGFYFLVETRLLGLEYLLFILFIIWATDTGAYFSGKFFGKRKLWPKISPNKTIEGALGGLTLALIVALIFHIVYPFTYSITYIAVVAILISIVGQIGDLVASAIKRTYDVKDSGNILPGHGGILDRLDSLLFMIPLLYIINFI